ncbi:MAG: hypothetical protein N2323_07755 [candidate division WOR-3 bacterium]|nr:hypothetical protein [candidate division WOR-3 bacterium]
MNTGLIITMGMVAVGGAVTEKILIAMGKPDQAEWIKLATTSLVGLTAVNLAIQLLKRLKDVL